MTATVAVVYSGARFPGGAETYLESLFRLRDRDRFRLVLVSLGEWALSESLRAAEEDVVVLSGRRVDPATVPGLVGLLRDRQVDLVASQGVVANAYARAAARAAGRPHLATVHSDLRLDYGSPLRRTLFGLAERMLRSVSVRFLVPSQYLRRRLVEGGVAAERVSVVYHGVRPLPRVERQASGRLVVGSVGRLHPTKGYDELIRATAEWGPEVEVVIHGEGPERVALERLIAELGLTERVRLPGYAADLAAAHRGMDVYVQPSRAEGFGLGVVEAMSAGLPVVVSAAGSLPELVDDGRTGVVVRAPGPAAVAAAVRGLLADEQRRWAMGSRAAEQARVRFGLDRWIEETMAVYGMAVDAGRRGSP